MGSGQYSTTSYKSDSGKLCFARANTDKDVFYKNTSREEIFKQKNINNAMTPHGIKFRESCDSKEHPNSLAIIIALDVTGSMGSVPHHLVKEGLPDFMGHVIQAGIKHPQVLFLGIGDHTCDSSPLQVGQFESSDELLDKWLTDVYLEGGGGGNEGESYLLAWYFASKHTKIDCLTNRNEKGFLFTIGDEPPLKSISENDLKSIMGPGQYGKCTINELLEKTREMYNVFHIHIAETMAGSNPDTVDVWKQLMGKNLIIAKHHDEVSKLIAKAIQKYSKQTITETIPDSEVML